MKVPKIILIREPAMQLLMQSINFYLHEGWAFHGVVFQDQDGQFGQFMRHEMDVYLKPGLSLDGVKLLDEHDVIPDELLQKEPYSP